VPEGCDLPRSRLDGITALAASSGVRAWVERDPTVAVSEASALYTDVWISMGQQAEEKKIKALRPYQLNRELIAKARPDAIVLHCLPAHRGEEITDEAMDGPWSAVFDQAENRLHVQKALLALLMAMG
jgi:ornithine carbamoyltransferase